MRRYGKNDSYCDVIVREKSVDDWQNLTIEIETSFNQQFIDRLKENIPYGARIWDDTNKVWRVMPRYQVFVERLAVELFDCARRVEGAVTTDLKTGYSVEQKGLF